MVTIKDFMHTEVKTITKDESVYGAAKVMSENGISCLIVVEDNSPIGIVTRRDIFENVLISRKDVDQTKVEDIMTKDIVTLKPEGTIIAASGIMSLKKVKQIPIVKDGKLNGIITQTDIVKNINVIMKYDKQSI